MNAKLSKQLRRAAGVTSRSHARTATEYEVQQYRSRAYEQMQADGRVALEHFACPLPLRLKRGSPRAVYKKLKQLERTVGLTRIQRVMGLNT